MNERRVLSAIRADKDVDGFQPLVIGRYYMSSLVEFSLCPLTKLTAMLTGFSRL